MGRGRVLLLVAAVAIIALMQVRFFATADCTGWQVWKLIRSEYNPAEPRPVAKLLVAQGQWQDPYELESASWYFMVVDEPVWCKIGWW